MRGIHSLMIILALPAIAALGHDIYLFSINDGLETAPELLNQDPHDKGILSLFATLGFIWTHYEPESYKWAVENTEEDKWACINTLLGQKAFFVGLIFAGASYVLIFIVKILAGLFSSSGGGSRSKGTKAKADDPRFLTRGKKNTFKYKKK